MAWPISSMWGMCSICSGTTLAVMVTQYRAEQAASVRQIDDNDVIWIRHFVAEQGRLDAGPHIAFRLAINHWVGSGLQAP